MPQRSSRAPVDVYEAFRDVVHDYGVADMAAKIGIPVGSLYNKANVNESSNAKPNLGDGVLVQVVSGDTRIVETEAKILGGVFLRLPSLSGVSDAALIEMLAEIHIQCGLFHDEIKKALLDKTFNKAEHARIHHQALRYVTAILEADKRIEGMVDD